MVARTMSFGSITRLPWRYFARMLLQDILRSCQPVECDGCGSTGAKQVLWQTRCEILEREKDQVQGQLEMLREHVKGL